MPIKTEFLYPIVKTDRVIWTIRLQTSLSVISSHNCSEIIFSINENLAHLSIHSFVLFKETWCALVCETVFETSAN